MLPRVQAPNVQLRAATRNRAARPRYAAWRAYVRLRATKRNDAQLKWYTPLAFQKQPSGRRIFVLSYKISISA